MPGIGMPGLEMPGTRHPQLLLCAGLWEQLPRAGGVRRGEKGGSGSRWGCLKAAESNGTSQRAVSRTGPPSRSTGTAACPYQGLEHPGKVLGRDSSGSRHAVHACPTGLILPPRGQARPKPSSLPWHRAAGPRCCTLSFTQHPWVLVTMATAASREQGRSIRAPAHPCRNRLTKAVIPAKALANEPLKSPDPGPDGTWGTVSRMGRAVSPLCA